MSRTPYEGLQDDIRELKIEPEIEAWKNEYTDRDYTIELTIPEFTSICPKTGLPDFGTILIRYIPDELCVELKSLKLYIHAYRNVGIFYEHVVNKILDDVVRACLPRSAEVIAEFNVRGGMRAQVSASYRGSE
ncbi:MAG: NADPH-dependent 7-cyano-7-deazaguanine reductase QueF [Gemmatimonadota bacterium]|nr:MAG: NADPH-dependent 7-cyano-7-deazaguanine reductase QueF [Gemmatimonadota bacterium]